MASDVRRCDICGDVFEIILTSAQKYNQLKLPSLTSLKRIAEYALHSDTRERVWTDDYDVCANCLLAICKAIFMRMELKE